MKSVSKAAILFGACAMLTVACKKENIQPTNGSDESNQWQNAIEKSILAQPEAGPNLLAVDQIYQTTQLHLSSLLFNMNYYRQAPALPNVKFKGIAAFGTFRAYLYDNNQFNNQEDFIEVSTGQNGKVKYNGNAVELDEIELIDGNINNMYATNGRQLFRLTYVPATAGQLAYFNATLIYSIPMSRDTFVVSTICPDASVANAFRVYYFISPLAITLPGTTFGNFSYVTISNATSTPIIGLTTTTTNPVLSTLSTTVPTINSFRSTLDNSMYVTVNGAIRKVGPTGVMTTISSTLIPTVSGSNTYQKVDCAFGNH
jgi:hypothetical protein